MRKVSEVTTEQIREATSKGFVASLGYKSISDTQFDLWLATERNRVAELAMAKERERILELLRKKIQQVIDDNNVKMDWDDHREWGLQIAVGLIEGENK